MINTNQAREAAMISAASYNYNEPANKQSPLPAGYKLTVNPNKNDEVLARVAGVVSCIHAFHGSSSLRHKKPAEIGG